jgi:phage-related tail fiber protein
MKKSYLLLIIFISILAFPLFAAEDWNLMNPATNPDGRIVYAMSYVGDDHVLLFGGTGDILGNETWVYDVSTDLWANMDPGTWVSGSDVPEPRRWQGMGYIGDDKALLFGGITGSSGSSRQNDTWIYDFSDNEWTKITPG